MAKGIWYKINGEGVTTPDEEVWTPVVIGTSLSGTQKRSPYWQLEWRKQVADACDVDWWEYDNTTLTSLWTRPPDKLDETVQYTDAICQSIEMRQVRGFGQEVVATFLVYVGT